MFFFAYCLLQISVTSQNHPLIFFEENTSLAQGLSFCAKFDPKIFDYNNRTPTFADFNGDGLKDLFIGLSNGKIAYWLNIGTAQKPCFRFVTDFFGGIQVQHGHAAPFFADLTGDGKLDCLIGNGSSGSLGGEVGFWINMGTAASPKFDQFSVQIGGVNLSDNSVPFAYDADFDGDLDVYVGDGFGGFLYFIENTGTKTNPVFDKGVVKSNIGTSWQSTFQFTNLMGDSTTEMVALDAYGTLRTFVQNGSPLGWSLVSQNPFVGLDICSQQSGCLSRAPLVDINNDSLPDLFVKVDNMLRGFYLNTGTKTQPKFDFSQPPISISVEATSFPASFYDLDGDGYVEIYMPRNDGKVEVWENQSLSGIVKWVLVNSDFLQFTNANPKSLSFGFLNKDTFPDVVVGGFYDGQQPGAPLEIWLNNGGGGFAKVAAPSLDNFPFNYDGRVVELVDFPKNGTPDLYITAGGQIFHFYSPDTSGINWVLVDKNLYGYKITFGDMNGDSVLDRLIGYSLTDPTYIPLYSENSGTNATPNWTSRYNWLTGVGGAYPTLFKMAGQCGPVLFVNGRFYTFKGIKPYIEYTQTTFCNNQAKQLNAQPQPIVWSSPVTSNGIFPANIIAGTYMIVATHYDRFGCHTLSDSTWLYSLKAPNPSILKLGTADIKSDTITVCGLLGPQQLHTAEPGGSWSVTGGNNCMYINSDGKFDPKNCPLGVLRAIYLRSENGCNARDTIYLNIKGCTVGLDNPTNVQPEINIQPNPFLNKTTITVDLAMAMDFEISISNFTGTVRRFVPTNGTMTNQIVEWDGRNGNGQLVPAGAYWVTVHTNNGTRFSRLLIKL